MRYSILILALGMCALFAMPAAAQQSPQYKPTSAEELQQLDRHAAPELVRVRGGDSTRQVGLNADEQDEFATLATEQVQELQILRDLRGGVHIVYVIAIPCIVVVAVVAIILILVLT